MPRTYPKIDIASMIPGLSFRLVRNLSLFSEGFPTRFTCGNDGIKAKTNFETGSRGNSGRYEAVVVGASAGGVEALGRLVGALPGDFPAPVMVAHHISPDSESRLAELLDADSALRVKEAEDGERIVSGTVYLSAPNYHLLVEKDGTLALSDDPLVNFARPSIDVLFESAAEAYGPALIGVILTGWGSDGSAGLRRIKELGGAAVVQSPEDAEAAQMPGSALAAVAADHVLPLAALPILLCDLLKWRYNGKKENPEPGIPEND